MLSDESTRDVVIRPIDVPPHPSGRGEEIGPGKRLMSSTGASSSEVRLGDSRQIGCDLLPLRGGQHDGHFADHIVEEGQRPQRA